MKTTFENSAFEHAFHQTDVKITAEELSYNGFFKLKKLTLQHKLFNGGWSAPFQRELCIRGDAVGVLLYDPQLQQIAMVEQIRIGVLNGTGVIERPQSPWLLELVAGMLDKENENGAEVARRETLEEAGLDIDQLEPIIEYFCSPGGSSEYFSLFCGRVNLKDKVTGVFGLDEEHEDIRLHILGVEDVLTLLKNGGINNAMSIIALQWLQLNKERLDALWL